MQNNQLIWGDCLEVLQSLPEKSIDLILTDPPYGQTNSVWDKVIPYVEFWKQHNRVIKDNGAVVITASQPFAAHMIVSNVKNFRYDYVWSKNKTTGYLNAKKQPLRKHEHILVFYHKQPTYNPQKTTGHAPVHSYNKRAGSDKIYRHTNEVLNGGGQTDRYPTSILKFNKVNNDATDRIHVNQKPLDLFQWMIRTYTNEGEMVLDSCLGSGTTAVAALNEGRQFIGIESDYEMYCKARDRINKAASQQPYHLSG